MAKALKNRYFKYEYSTIATTYAIVYTHIV